MIEVNEPKNIVAMVISTSPAWGEIQVLGKDRSVSIRMSKALAGTALSDLSGITVHEEDPVDDEGPQDLADLESNYFTASYVGFDLSDDQYNVIMLVKKSGRSFLKINLRSHDKDDMETALTTISSIT
jgi:hypothetical protein